MDKWARANYQPCLPLGTDGQRVTSSAAHIALSRRAAGEGMVLLKNDNRILPLPAGSCIAVFGKGQYDYVKGGGGSGDVNCCYTRNIYDGLKIKEAEGKLTVFDGLIDFYKTEIDRQYHDGAAPGKTTEPMLPEHLIDAAAAFTDTAVITICRFSEEGWDRKGIRGDGDFYLSPDEDAMVKAVTARFKNIIVVINAGAQTDTEWYHSNDKISAVLYSWQAGMEGGLAIADILCGDVNPSGKLVDTFAKTFADYPSADTFAASPNYVKYYEDIYVGYRYFETIPGAAERVNYPFGFGLSYTDFEINRITAAESDGEIIVTASVRNTGSVPGKEVVQVYYSAPQGLLGKPARELAGFLKTQELAPGESESVTIPFKIQSMASYDDTGKVQKSAYVLEKGHYRFYVGNSVRNTVKTDYEYVLNENVITEQLSQCCPPSKLEKRMTADGSFEPLNCCAHSREIPVTATADAKKPAKKALLADVSDGGITLNEFIAQLTDEELISLTYGKPNTGVANTGGMGGLKKYGIPCIMTADGPAGLRLNTETGVYTTAFPCATLMASSWNTKLMEEVGIAGAAEVKENNIGIWLTPALNIHRNPLCGRNFEYFSEDPLVSGKMAAAKVRGIQSQHIAASVKHFCVNNKEENRMDSDSIISERALREIYLKGFEICVKDAAPWTLMSSYNLVNGIRASENYDTLTQILRNEWNFSGMVTSDWWNHAEPYRELKAGNDIKMPVSFPSGVRAALHDGKITRAEIEKCVKHILEMILKIE